MYPGYYAYRVNSGYLAIEDSNANLLKDTRKLFKIVTVIIVVNGFIIFGFYENKAEFQNSSSLLNSEPKMIIVRSHKTENRISQIIEVKDVKT